MKKNLIKSKKASLLESRYKSGRSAFSCKKRREISESRDFYREIGPVASADEPKDNRGSEKASFTFIDLFAGIGGFRLALESFGGKCVYTSEWDKYAQLTYKENFREVPNGDITRVEATDIPKHDVLCAGFPCQAFSSN